MQRIDAPEILDSDACSAHEAHAVLQVLGRINRWFGGVTTTRRILERAAQATGMKHFSLLEVAAGLGEVPEIIQKKLSQRGITLDITLLDSALSHLPAAKPAPNAAGRNRGVVGDALALPFADGSFDLVSCNLFAHHLNPQLLQQFIKEGLRVSRCALLINDLVRHPLHLALTFAGYPIMRNRVAWLDGITSVRRAYTPKEIQSTFRAAFSSETMPQVEISRHYLFRMGVIVRKSQPEVRTP
jgi:ubiquinone/menaquinone biosynthesis C-methylase UbiE